MKLKPTHDKVLNPLKEEFIPVDEVVDMKRLLKKGYNLWMLYNNLYVQGELEIVHEKKVINKKDEKLNIEVIK